VSDRESEGERKREGGREGGRQGENVCTRDLELDGDGMREASYDIHISAHIHTHKRDRVYENRGIWRNFLFPTKISNKINKSLINLIVFSNGFNSLKSLTVSVSVFIKII
jgi:hypothetical protein